MKNNSLNIFLTCLSFGLWLMLTICNLSTTAVTRCYFLFPYWRTVMNNLLLPLNSVGAADHKRVAATLPLFFLEYGRSPPTGQ